MNGCWQTVWQISARRHETQCGDNHLTAHGLNVLQAFVSAEQDAAMEAVMGHVHMVIVTEDDDE